MAEKNSTHENNVTHDQFSDKLNNGWKTAKMADLLRFFCILRQ